MRMGRAKDQNKSQIAHLLRTQTATMTPFEDVDFPSVDDVLSDAGSSHDEVALPSDLRIFLGGKAKRIVAVLLCSYYLATSHICVCEFRQQVSTTLREPHLK